MSRAGESPVCSGGRRDAARREIYFFDTPELTLNKVGVVLRARAIEDDDHDLVDKIRPVEEIVAEPSTRIHISLRLLLGENRTKGMSCLNDDLWPGLALCDATSSD